MNIPNSVIEDAKAAGFYSEGSSILAEGRLASVYITEQLIKFAELTLARNVPQWIRVEDRLPPIETDVLVKGINYNNELKHDIAGIFQGEWSSQVTEDCMRFTVTQWMPLPQSPNTENAE